MNRSQRRLAEKQNPKLALSKEDVKRIADKAWKDEVSALKKEIYEEARIEFMLGAMVLPMMVLMDHFWQKSYAQKIPKFTELLLEYYQDWEDGKLDPEKMAEDLWNYGGVRLERNTDE